jgi:hypothetical protein
VEHLPDAADNIDLNVRATRYLIVESRACCPQCDVVTRVFAFALPAGYESLNVGDDTPAVWIPSTDSNSTGWPWGVRR